MSIIPHSWKSLPGLPENSSESCASPPPTIANASVHAVLIAASTSNSLASMSMISIGRPPTPPWSLHHDAKATDASYRTLFSPGRICAPRSFATAMYRASVPRPASSAATVKSPSPHSSPRSPNAASPDACAGAVASGSSGSSALSEAPQAAPTKASAHAAITVSRRIGRFPLSAPAPRSSGESMQVCHGPRGARHRPESTSGRMCPCRTPPNRAPPGPGRSGG